MFMAYLYKQILRRLYFACGRRQEMANPINALNTLVLPFERVIIKPNTARASDDVAISLIKPYCCTVCWARRSHAFKYCDKTHYVFRFNWQRVTFGFACSPASQGT